jgi:hypothetical protein
LHKVAESIYIKSAIEGVKRRVEIEQLETMRKVMEND